MLRECARFWFAIMSPFIVASAGCDIGWGAAERPDVSGTWDLTYDDYLELELEIGGELHRQRVPLSGGAIHARRSGVELRATVACERDEVVCPNEIWSRQLTLSNRIGQVDGERFSIWLQGEGQGACQLGPGSRAVAELDTVGEPGGRYEATMLTGGKIVTELSAACLRSLGAGELPSGARVRVSAGFSGVRRAPGDTADVAPREERVQTSSPVRVRS